MSKYGDLIKKARETEPENQKAINTSDQTSGLPEPKPELEQMVNLCVKVPISQRRYWMSKAKEQGITVTSVIVEALTQKFGEPDNQKARKP
ncbi:hypothetical protein [Nostoc sp. FACHB-888]|uniref:hypothetical protein n=1 Tax=Nostoc sp. FACHB-888 TaxID=2692842 RepID=UPI00168959FA|nr:hypothetical protein [Nostoc sp. FACHB-888]MBD2249405.1 hypothetical protein [Nostoc sp. FACHB-888]